MRANKNIKNLIKKIGEIKSDIYTQINKQLNTRRVWLLVISLLCLLFYIYSFMAFRPGFISPDSFSQYSQAINNNYSDWHPAIMAILWHFLHIASHRMSIMLLFQLSLWWVAIGLMCVFVYDQTQSKIKSFFPIFIGLCPFVMVLSGVIWKDVQLAFSLALLVALAIYFNNRSDNKLKYIILGFCIPLLVYAGNIRHGIIVSLIPLIFLVGLSLSFSLRKNIIFIILILLIITGAGYVINYVFHVSKTYPETQVMVDDIKELSSVEAIKNSNILPFSKTYLINIKHECAEKGVKTNALFQCGNPADFDKVGNLDHSGIRRLWITTLERHPLQYMKFRIDDYIHFTVPNNNIYVIPEPNIVNNSFGIQVQNNIFNKTINKYFKFSEMDYGFGYKAYFWIIINLFLIFFAIQRLKHYKFASYAILILLSGLIYILQIFPVTIATDYRYYYWLVIATLIGALVIVIDSPLKSKK